MCIDFDASCYFFIHMVMDDAPGYGKPCNMSEGSA